MIYTIKNSCDSLKFCNIGSEKLIIDSLAIAIQKKTYNLIRIAFILLSSSCALEKQNRSEVDYSINLYKL